MQRATSLSPKAFLISELRMNGALEIRALLFCIRAICPEAAMV